MFPHAVFRQLLLLLLTISVSIAVNSSDEGGNNPEESKDTGEEQNNDDDWSLEDNNDEIPVEDLQGGDIDEELRGAMLRYRVHSRARPWFDAMTSCSMKGGLLATPEDEEEAHLLGRILAATVSRANISHTDMVDAMHIGFHNLGLDRSWFTTEGEISTFGSWIDDLTFAKHDEWLYRCAAVLPDGRFLHISPSQKLIYACDMKPKPHKKPATSDPEDNYISLDERHRYRLYTTPLSWLEALDACEREGASLASFEDKSSAQRVAELLFAHGESPSTDSSTPVALLGINDLTDEGDWRNVAGEYFPMHGTWAEGEPRGERNANCGAITATGLYADVACDQPFPYVCEKRKPEAAEIVSYVTMPGIGRYAFHQKQESWMGAYIKCKAENAMLAVPKSANQAKFMDEMVMKALINNTKEMERWTHWNRTPEVIVGVHDMDGNDKWRTIEDVPLSKSGFKEWLRYDPNYHRGLMKCGGLSSGKYVRISCDAVHMYICQKPLSQDETEL